MQRKNGTTGVYAKLSFHRHIRDFAIYDGWAAGIESGRYMETIGFFSIEVSVMMRLAGRI